MMVRAILIGGGMAGVLDAIFAVTIYVFVLRAYSIVGVLQYIASGLLGASAFSGGFATAALGVAIHFVLAFAFAAIFGVLWQRVDVLRNSALVSGIAYGAAIWMFMSFVVLPLTGTPKTPFVLGVFASFLIDHALFVGLPIAFACRAYIRGRSRTPSTSAVTPAPGSRDAFASTASQTRKVRDSSDASPRIP